jgi:formylglycine-generating enzyme required for sulfatase activity
MGVHPVTQGQWQSVTGNNPSCFSRSGECKDWVEGISDADLKQFPVERVSWDDAQKFLEELSRRDNPGGGWLHRLPTDGEWEYSCRGGATTKEECSFDFYFATPTHGLASNQANCNGNYPASNALKENYLGRPTKVGSYPANVLGICDMHGNVFEWCQDWYEESSSRVIRGGGWRLGAENCRAAYRGRFAPDFRISLLGFRLALVPSGM